VVSWVYLFAAIVLEVIGTTCMKLSQGFTRLTPSLLMVAFYVASLTLLNLALKKVEVSIAYAIWSGVGTVLIAAIGILYFREPATALKLIAIVLIIIGCVMLNLAGAH
jgi:small multidrug resistance pump